MTQADRVLSTPPTNTPICQSAPGAVQLSSPPVILTSHAPAGQGVKNEPEPSRGSEIQSSGAVISRRSVMNMFVSTAAIVAVPTTAPASPQTSDRRALEAYASWLFMERRILCGELWPDMGAEAERYDYYDNAGAGWHFRGDGDWRDLPQPSTRAATVLDLVGVDWRQP